MRALFLTVALAAIPVTAVAGPAPYVAPIPPITMRAPGPTDDAAHGFLPSDMWQSPSGISTEVDGTPGSATWTVPTPAPYPRDAMGTVTGDCATVALSAGYTGLALRIQILRGGVAVTRDISILPSGELDTASEYGFLAGRDAGTTGTVVRCYVQDGLNVNFWAPPSGAAGPDIGVVRVAGHEAMSWGDASTNTGLTLTSTLTAAGGTSTPVMVNPQNFSLYLYGRFYAATTASAMLLAELGVSTSTAKADALYIGAPGFLDVNPVNQGAGAIANLNFRSLSSPGVFGVVGTAASLSAINDARATPFANTLPAGPLSAGASVGWSGSFSSLPGTMALIGWSLGQAGSAVQQSGIVAGAISHLGLPTQARTQLLVFGDSRDHGYEVADGQSWPALIGDDLASPIRIMNWSITGNTLEQTLVPSVGTLARGLTFYDPTAQNIAVIGPLGTNSIGLAGDSIATTVSLLQQACAMAAATLVGPTDHVLISNELPRGDQYSASLAQLHAAIAAASFPGCAVVDPQAISALQNPANPAYWNADTLHPTAAGEMAEARFFAGQIGSLLATGH